MGQDEEYTVESARAAAERGSLEAWVAAFLASPGSDNADLADELAERLGWWIGPVQVPLDELHRLAGPSDEPALVEWDEEDWRGDVDELAGKVEAGWSPPPVVVSYWRGQLRLEDGNHRVEGVRRAGEDKVWAVIGFSDAEDRERFTPPSAS